MDCGNSPVYHMGCGLSGENGNFLPVSAFSAFNLLRNCNYLLNNGSIPNTLAAVPNSQEKNPPSAPLMRNLIYNVNQVVPPQNELGQSNISKTDDGTTPIETSQVPSKTIFSPGTLLNLNHSVDSLLENTSPNPRPHPLLFSPTVFRKHRSEKKPIPNEQKDDKYFERRRRNNQAAKKSRDARKLREDQIALKATILEHENAILRAQILTLREEASSLRHMVMQRKAFELHINRDPQICMR